MNRFLDVRPRLLTFFISFSKDSSPPSFFTNVEKPDKNSLG